MFSRKRGILILSLMAMLFILSACGDKKDTVEDAVNNTPQEPTEQTNYAADVKENPIVTITMANDEKIVLELDPKVAPNTVANFISLVEDGFYNGLIFHRVIPGFMIQGGDPLGNGTGGPGHSIAGEFTSNGFENNLIHERGVISMARSQSPDSAGSQFFIMTENSPHLDGQYAAFGKVIEGIETVDNIVNAETAGEKPVQDQQMKKVEVDTKGFDYPAPVVK